MDFIRKMNSKQIIAASTDSIGIRSYGKRVATVAFQTTASVTTANRYVGQMRFRTSLKFFIELTDGHTHIYVRV